MLVCRMIVIVLIWGLWGCQNTQSSTSTEIYANDHRIESIKDVGTRDHALLKDQEIKDQEIKDQEIIDLYVDPACAQPEKCNFKDDDCDLNIDEGQACGHLLANHCELTLGWTTNPIDQIENLDHWPSLSTDRLSAGCPQVQSPQNIESLLNTTCSSSGRDQKFHALSLYESVGAGDQLGLHFRCYAESEDLDENALLNWVDSYCSVALAYDDENDGTSFSNMGLTASGCEQMISVASDGAPRCIKSRLDYPRTFSILNLEGTLDESDRFGIALTCSDIGRFKDMAGTIPSFIELFLGFSLKPHIDPIDLNEICMVNDQMPQSFFYRCPLTLNAQSSNDPSQINQICFGSSGTQWGEMQINIPHPFVGLCDQLFMGIFPARER